MSRLIRLVYKCDHCGDEALATVSYACGYASAIVMGLWQR